MPPVHFRLGPVDNAAGKMKKIKEYVDNGMNAAMDVALDFEEVSAGNEHVKELQEAMVQYVKMDREISQWLEAVEKTKQQFEHEMNAASGDEIPNIEGIFKDQLGKLEANNTDEELANHKKVTEFMEKIWNVHHEGERLPAQGTEGSLDDDDDVIMSQAPKEQTKCPLTLKEMVKPMRNKKCGHNYDEEAILQHIANRRGRKAKCPVGGCPQEVARNDLEHNTALEHHIKRKNRTK